MTTERKRAANARNALRSTGPRTAAGKARSARNRITHGLLSREALLPGENREEFEALTEGFRKCFQPKGMYEEILVDIITREVWKMRRLGRVEVDILSWRPSRTPIGGGIVIYDAAAPETINRFLIPDNHRGPKRESVEADQISAKAEEAALPIGLAFLQGCGGSGADAFGMLSRYEVPSRKALYQAAHELERRQRERLRGDVPAPVAIDVSVSGTDDGRTGGIHARRQSRMDAAGSPAVESGRIGHRGQIHTERVTQTESAIEAELFE
jgi:hypothetical protein